MHMRCNSVVKKGFLRIRSIARESLRWPDPLRGYAPSTARRGASSGSIVQRVHMHLRMRHFVFKLRSANGYIQGAIVQTRVETRRVLARRSTIKKKKTHRLGEAQGVEAAVAGKRSVQPVGQIFGQPLRRQPVCVHQRGGQKQASRTELQFRQFFWTAKTLRNSKKEDSVGQASASVHVPWNLST